MTRSALLITMLLIAGASPIGAQTQAGGLKALPGARPGSPSTIRGKAVKSPNGQLSNATVRLRDVRFGRIVDTQAMDKTGGFAFKAVNPGNYVIEVLGPDRTVLAATPLLNVDAGQDISPVVISVPAFGAVRNSTPSAAVIITSAAAASGVLATTIAGDPVSPGK